MNHICEQYFSGSDDNTSDYISEGLMKSLIHSSHQAIKDPNNYEARSNIMWIATWALNTLVAKGKTTDALKSLMKLAPKTAVHMLGQAVGAYTDATHGMTLAAVSLPYYRYIMPYGLDKFVRFAENVWDIHDDHLSKEDLALAGLNAMEKWMKDLGLVMNLSDLGVKEDMIEGLADATLVLEGGYKVLDRNEIMHIFKQCL